MPLRLRPIAAARPARLVAPVALAMAAAVLVGCGSDAGAGADGTVRVEASFYPLQWMAEEVGGERVTVTNLTRPGAEPHDLELTPRDVADLADADVIAYLSGFQPAVDDAVAESGATAFDAAEAADLDRTLDGDDGHGHGEEGDEHEGEEEGAHEDEGDAAVDPHFWLDPTKLAAVAEAFADTLAEQDPDGAATYRANAADLVDRLEALDGELEAGLASCTNRELVTSHEAFGYLADRYDLEQLGIAGLSPEQEPSAGELAEASEFVSEHDVRTIYFETLVSPDVAETVATEAGADTAVLDPLEGLTDDSAGGDYLEVMRSNLKTLQEGQPCP